LVRLMPSSVLSPSSSFNPPATPQLYTLSLHDALPISAGCCRKSCLNSVLSRPSAVLSRPSAPSAGDAARRRARSVSLTLLTSLTVTLRTVGLFLRLVVSPGEHGRGIAPSGWLTRHASALYCAHVGLERQLC